MTQGTDYLPLEQLPPDIIRRSHAPRIRIGDAPIDCGGEGGEAVAS